VQWRNPKKDITSSTDTVNTPRLIDAIMFDKLIICYFNFYCSVFFVYIRTSDILHHVPSFFTCLAPYNCGSVAHITLS
jgi:hypothetical protein